MQLTVKCMQCMSYKWKQQKDKGENSDTRYSKTYIFLHVYYFMKEMDNFKLNKWIIKNNFSMHISKAREQ